MSTTELFKHIKQELEKVIKTKEVNYEDLFKILPESKVPDMLKPLLEQFTFTSINKYAIVNKIAIDALGQIAVETKTFKLQEIDKKKFITTFIKISKGLPYKLEFSIGFTNETKYTLAQSKYRIQDSPELYLTSISKDFTGLNEFPLSIQYGMGKPTSLKESGDLLGLTGYYNGYDDDIELDLISERIERTVTLLFILGVFELNNRKANDLTSSLVFTTPEGTLRQRYMNYEISRLKSLFTLKNLSKDKMDENLMLINQFYTLKKKSGKEYLSFDNNLRLYSLILGTKHQDIKISLMVTLLENLTRIDLSKEEKINHSSLSFVIANEIGESYRSRIGIKETIDELVSARNKIIHEGARIKGLSETLTLAIIHIQYLMSKRLLQLLKS